MKSEREFEKIPRLGERQCRDKKEAVHRLKREEEKNI